MTDPSFEPTNPKPPPERRVWRWKRTVGVALGIAVIVSGAWWLRAYLEARPMKECAGHLRQIGVALLAYHDRYDSLPPAYVAGADGTRLHSWRVLLLPFLGHDDLYQQYDFNEPWNGTHNLALAGKIPGVYACPSALGREPGVTNYLAIVGRATAWPEQYSARFRNFLDGVSNTILVVESGTSDVLWLEPRDITHREALQRDESGTFKVLMTTQHPSGVTNVLLGDGAIPPAIRREINPGVFMSLLTINGGWPLPGVDGWPTESDPAKSGFSAPRPAAEFRATDVIPCPPGPVATGRNTVYCATFELAWDDQRRHLGLDPLQVAGDPPLATLLNRHRFDRRNLSEAAYVARGGSGNARFREQLREEIARKFPGTVPRLVEQMTDDTALYIYTFLRKDLPFKAEFDSLPVPIQFHEQGQLQEPGQTVPVSGFGVERLDDSDLPGEQIQSQVTILDYVSDDDFVLRLLPASAQDEIVLAKITPGATLAETVDLVWRRIARPGGDPAAARLHRNETLAVPKLEVSIQREYTELAGLDVMGTLLHIEHPLQIIQVRLDETGAVLISEGKIPDNNGHTLTPLGERKFVFNRPFLIYLIERDGNQPYFAAWIANSELMTRRE